MQSEKSIKVPKILTTIALPQWQGILVLLDRFEAQASTPSGVLIPKYDTYYTEGGQHAAKHSTKEFTSVGTVIDISPSALASIEENWGGLSLQQGSRVWLQPSCVQPRNQFILERDTPVTVSELTGESPFLLITPQNVEAILDEKYQIIYE